MNKQVAVPFSGIHSKCVGKNVGTRTEVSSKLTIAAGSKMTHDHDGAANARNMREIRWHPCTIDAPIKIQCVWCVRVLVMVMDGWGWVVKVGWWCVCGCTHTAGAHRTYLQRWNYMCATKEVNSRATRLTRAEHASQRRVPAEKPCADMHLCTSLAFPLGSLPFPLERWGTQQVSAGFL